MKYSAAAGFAWPKMVLPGLLIILLSISCQPKHPHNSWIPDGWGYHSPNDSAYPINNQVVVWKNPDSTEDAFQGWLISLKRERPNVRALAVCANCDADMLLLYDPDQSPSSLPSYLQSQTVGSNGNSPNPGGPSGGNGPVLFCSNLNLNLRELSPDPVTTSTVVDTSWLVPGTGAGLTIAVFDSGLDSIPGSEITNLGQTCLLTGDASSQNGWNFVYNNSNTRDDIQDLHGTRVTKLIIDQIRRYRGDNINILPVKIFDSTGKGSLYGILCAVAYAANAGAKIINASFGFYHYADADTSGAFQQENLMHAYLSHYLAKNSMLLVAAAGNDNLEEDTTFAKVTGWTSDTTLRELDTNRFYPAYFALTDTNIISVTTVSPQTHSPSRCPLENFSPKSVDVGVNCDTIYQGYDFFDPLQVYTTRRGLYRTKTITGSSFATPIVTGRIAAFYSHLSSKTNKQSIIGQLNRIRVPAGTPPALKIGSFTQFILNGEIAP